MEIQETNDCGAGTSSEINHMSTQTSPKKVKFPSHCVKNRRIKILQQRLKRRNIKINNLKDILKVLKENQKSDSDLEHVLTNNFDGFTLDLAMNEARNTKSKPSQHFWF